MCGIAGVWNLNNKLVELNELEKFTDSLIHRGPDGSGYSLYDNETLGLGHRRLSILDLSENGKQPLEYLNNRYSITYNGEIYNFIELKKILLSEGYNFKSESDTEVILAAYDFWGKDCLKKFNGMWAFAIWDNFKKKLFLSRDRFGVKPLHYIYKQNDFFAFASETIAFKYLSNFKREFDTQLLSRSILSFSSIEAFGYTIFKDVTQLLPGHYIEIKKGQKPVQIKWWSTLNNLVTFPTNYEDQVAYFKEIFEDACRIRMRSDVPLASALSGGVDSSAVYCMLHHLMNDNSIQKERLPSNWQKAFVATFPNTKVDERHYAEEVIKFTNGNAKYLIPDYTKLISDIEKGTILFDGISGGPIICLTDVYKGMRADKIIVSMDGHGVDEMMYGYRNSVFSAMRMAIEHNDPSAMALKETYLDILFPEERKEKQATIEALFNSKNRQYPVYKKLRAVKHHLFPPKKVNGLSPINSHDFLKEQEIRSIPYISDDFYREKNRETKESIIYNHFHYDELPYNLRDFDRGSMQHGIEIRMPFMDYRLVSFIFSIPQQSKIGGGFTKRILRDSMKGIMPEIIRNRKLKIGLGSPMVEWFNGPMSEFLQDEINSLEFQQSTIFEGKKLSEWALSKAKNKRWSDVDCSLFWPYLNAHILIKNNK